MVLRLKSKAAQPGLSYCFVFLTVYFEKMTVFEAEIFAVFLPETHLVKIMF